MGVSGEKVLEILDAVESLSSVESLDNEHPGRNRGSVVFRGSAECRSDRPENRHPGSLSERERQVIVLRYFKDMTQQQIAGILGISQVQVSRIEKKVLERMREKMMG